MSNVLLSRKLKNLINKNTNLELEFYLNNIIVNGCKRGCSGFIRNSQNNLIVYTNTELSGPLSDKLMYMYRYASNLNDFGGGTFLQPLG